MRSFVAAALAIVCILCASARADTITLKDGRTFVGKIKSTTETQIVFDTKVGKIRTTLTFKRMEIAKIEKGDPPADFDDKSEKPAPAGAAPSAPPAPVAPPPAAEDAPASPSGAAAPGGPMFLEIPIEGVFGEDILAAGVKDALEFAEKRGVQHIVFTIDSPGGYVAAADDIAALLKQHANRLKYHALIKNALSASIWVALSCDSIFMKPGSSIGAAVVFSKERTSGAAEVDAKFNSAITAKLASLAETKGHNPDLVRAMCVMDACVFTWKDASGEMHIADKAPADSKANAKQLDSRNTVLTLTQEQAVELGFAKAFQGGPEGLGELVGLPGWRKAGDYGIAAMHRTGAKAKKDAANLEADRKSLEQKIPAVIKYINAAVIEARNADPHKFDYPFYVEGGMFTPQAQVDWRNHTDDAIAAWRRVLDGIKELYGLEQKAEKVGFERNVHDVNMKDVAATADREIARLNSERNRTSK